MTFELFADWMDIANRYHSDKLPPTSAAMWVRTKGREALAGEWYLHGEGWKWRVRNKKKTITFDVDMASSGQRSTWPLLALAETLLVMRMQGELDEDMTIYVEEPEIHLHPEAQVGIIEILAILVNEGFRIVITTHSLVVLYALNNLTQATTLGDLSGLDLPEPRARLAGPDVIAWLLDGSEPRKISDESGYIDQTALGQVSEHLGNQLNAIAMMQRRQTR